MVLLEPTIHFEDCCLPEISCFSRNSRSRVGYLNIASAMKPTSHRGIPSPEPSKWKELIIPNDEEGENTKGPSTLSAPSYIPQG
jgi:hypothetical protein